MALLCDRHVFLLQKEFWLISLLPFVILVLCEGHQGFQNICSVVVSCMGSQDCSVEGNFNNKPKVVYCVGMASSAFGVL